MSRRVPELDGIRAVACLAVIGYHAAVPLMGNGRAGVDVFFVLSGWLITGLLLDELQNHGRIRVGAFYARRAARLYPPLILLVIAVLLFPGSPTTAGDALLTLTYFTDISRTFGHDVHWLGHSWSLSVEEHFYLLWPLAMMACRTRRAVAIAAAVGVVVSFASLPLVDPPGLSLGIGGYNFPGTRAWELLAGGLLAATLSGVTLGRAGRVLGGIVVPLLAVAVLAVPGVDVGRTPFTLGVVIMTCGLLLAVQSGGGATRWLAVAPLPWLGRISYGAYLAHFPITEALRLQPWAVQLSSAVLGSFALAALSWWLLEAPVQRWARARLRPDRTIVLEGSRRPADGVASR